MPGARCHLTGMRPAKRLRTEGQEEGQGMGQGGAEARGQRQGSRQVKEGRGQRLMDSPGLLLASYHRLLQ